MGIRQITISCGTDTLIVEGLFLYGPYPAGIGSAQAFWRDYVSNKPVFDQCIGSYRVRVIREDGSELYFGDNAGVLSWYLDTEQGMVLNRLSDVPRERRKPDTRSIAQFLWFGCIYGMGTPFHGIERSDPENCYLLQNGQFQVISKKLTPLEELSQDPDALEHYVRRVLKGMEGQETIGCTITGGTDSRAVLSHLVAAGIRPTLCITGTNDHVDVRIGRQIAQILGLDIHVVSGDPSEDFSWLKRSLQESDGRSGACGIYRLLHQFEVLEEKGITLQFGGGAGELYKNSFINQDFPFYSGNPDWERFLKFKVITYDFPRSLCGSNLLPAVEEIPQFLAKLVQRHSGKTKASAYLSAGYRILQARGSAAAMMENQYVTTCNPLLERCVAAPMFRTKPGKLEMQAYQRRQVAQYCPQIQNVPTDRNLTCNPTRQGREWLKSMLYLVNVALCRIVHRGVASGRIDTSFFQGLQSAEYLEAVAQCKTLGILSPQVEPDAIPQSIADRVMTIGWLFR